MGFGQPCQCHDLETSELYCNAVVKVLGFFLIEKQNILLVEGLIIWNMEVKLKPRLIITVPGVCYLLSAFTLMCVYRESFYSHKLFPDEMCSKIGEECFLRNVYDSNENACIPKTK